MASENDNARAAVTALMIAASRGDYASALRLLAESEVNARDRLGNTALIYAAAGGHAEVVRLLLGAGADDAARADPSAAAADGRTPLHFSAQLGEVGLVRMLLARGADPERRDHHGETPLEAAVRGGATDAAHALADWVAKI